MADFAARIRAARGYADLTQEQLADRLGVDRQTIKRRELGPGHKGYKEPKKGERLAIAQICGVPVKFMEEGFGGEARSEISERLAELQEELRTLDRDLSARVREALTQQPDIRREIHEAFEAYARRLGGESGKLPPRSKRSQDPPAQEPPAAA
jgi:transcriptional regulator with XRE-family HTH domain